MTEWFAEECWNKDLYDEMMAETNLAETVEWFEDTELTEKPVSTQVAFAGEHPTIWAKTNSGIDFHLIHCLYLWRQLHLNVLEHRSIDMDTFCMTTVDLSSLYIGN